VSQIKSALGDFLIAVDVLLLKERCDDVQKELYFEKVLETLEVTRDALAVRLIDLLFNLIIYFPGFANFLCEKKESEIPLWAWSNINVHIMSCRFRKIRNLPSDFIVRV
jgi:hypothetical protein